MCHSQVLDQTQTRAAVGISLAAGEKLFRFGGGIFEATSSLRTLEGHGMVGPNGPLL